MNIHIKVLEDNDWICNCVCPWDFIFLLATERHQKEWKNIKKSIWWLCVTYSLLNSIIRSLEFPIPYCTDRIEDFGDSSGPIYFISLDAQYGY